MNPCTRTLRFRSDHPILGDHFPGHPIIPGALLLDAILDEVSAVHPDLGILGLREMKFLAPITTDLDAELRFEVIDTLMKFEVIQAGHLTAKGDFRICIPPQKTS